MKIEVLNPGVSSTIQDSGRLNGLAYGVPRGGAMDLNLAFFANSIVGNPISYPVIEFTMNGGKYLFHNKAKIAVAGNSLTIRLNDVEQQNNNLLEVKEGDVLTVKSNGKYRYSYLAIQGRLNAEEYWGSYSTYEFAKKGGYKGRRLLKGDVLSVNITPTYYSKRDFPESALAIRIQQAPETDLFSQDDIKLMESELLKVSNECNRMGYRLDGVQLKGTKTGNVISSGVLPGTIQVPKSGKPIVLMSDSPSTGGYPRIAVIHSDDLGLLAQKLPGQSVKFKWDEI